jgi:arginine utilization protein RocB
VEGIGELNIPALIIGPQGKDIHKRGERVYLPDVTGRIPDLIGRIIEQA